jgi:hypothetical protein
MELPAFDKGLPRDATFHTLWGAVAGKGEERNEATLRAFPYSDGDTVRFLSPITATSRTDQGQLLGEQFE